MVTRDMEIIGKELLEQRRRWIIELNKQQENLEILQMEVNELKKKLQKFKIAIENIQERFTKRDKTLDHII